MFMYWKCENALSLKNFRLPECECTWLKHLMNGLSKFNFLSNYSVICYCSTLVACSGIERSTAPRRSCPSRVRASRVLSPGGLTPLYLPLARWFDADSRAPSRVPPRCPLMTRAEKSGPMRKTNGSLLCRSDSMPAERRSGGRRMWESRPRTPER